MHTDTALQLLTSPCESPSAWPNFLRRELGEEKGGQGGKRRAGVIFCFALRTRDITRITPLAPVFAGASDVNRPIYH
jgi:hypothetical protein